MIHKYMGAILLIIAPLFLYGQYKNNTWLLGYDNNWSGAPWNGSKLVFNQSNITITYDERSMCLNGCYSGLSATDNSWFVYTNGSAVCNKNNDTLTNGYDLSPGGNDGYRQGGYPIPGMSLIIPAQNTGSLLYLFHENILSGASGFPPVGQPRALQLYYSLIDPTAGINGTVFLKNQILIDDTLEIGNLTACRHANGRDWWLLVKRFNSSIYYTILTSPNGPLVVNQQIVPGAVTVIGGQAGFSADGTHFANINCGILSTNTDVSVINCDFNDITDRYPSNIFFNDGCGIYHESINGNNSTLTVKPYQGITHSQMFVNCLNGISLRNSNATMRYLGFYGCSTGILGNLAFGKRVIMEYNYIEARRFGIDYNLIDDVNLFVINHNEIYLNTIKSIVGIRINAASPTQATVSNIKVQDNDVTVVNGHTGIEATSILHPKINENRVTHETASVPFGADPDWAHIRSNTCDGIDISCNNTYLGNNPNHWFDGADIQINQSKKSWIACNATEGMSYRGLEIHGTCNNSTIQTNIFGQHQIGLYLDNSCFIGKQPDNIGDAPARNLWTSTLYSPSVLDCPGCVGDEGAVNINSSNQNVILDNQFKVQFPINTQQWPKTFPSASSGWFTGTLDSPLGPCAGGYCPGKPANHGDGSSSTWSFRMAVALGLVNSNGYPVQTKWMLERDLMKELKGSDSLRNSNDTLLQFYNDSSKLILQKLIDIGDTLSSSSMITDSTMIIINENDSLLRAIDEEIAFSVLLLNDSSLADTTNVIIQQLLAQYRTISDINKNLLVTLKGESTTLATAAWGRNTEIEPNNFNEFIEQKVNDIYLRSFGRGIDTLTTQDKTDLESIIHICPLAGGPAVYRARAMYNLFNDSIYYNDKLVCSIEGYFRESQEQLMPELTKFERKNINFNIFPNPSKSKITILTEGFQGDAQITVYNLMGQLIDSFSIQQGNNTKEVDINAWAEGYYSIHCSSVDFVAVKSLIKIK